MMLPLGGKAQSASLTPVEKYLFSFADKLDQGYILLHYTVQKDADGSPVTVDGDGEVYSWKFNETTFKAPLLPYMDRYIALAFDTDQLYEEDEYYGGDFEDWVDDLMADDERYAKNYTRLISEKDDAEHSFYFREENGRIKELIVFSYGWDTLYKEWFLETVWDFIGDFPKNYADLLDPENRVWL